MSLLPDNITDERFVALEQVLDKRLDGIDLGAVLVMLIDNVHESALPHLGKDFVVIDDVWNAATVAERRELLKTAVERRRIRGTLGAVEDAIAAIGFGDRVVVRSRPDLGADGSVRAGGTFTAGPASPFLFWLIAVGEWLTPEQESRVEAAFEAWKQKSCWLDPTGCWFRVNEASEVDSLKDYESHHTVGWREEVVFIRSDDPDAQFALDGTFLSIPNRGHWGGETYLDDADPGPEVQLRNGRNSMLTTTNGGMMYPSEGLEFLHAPSGDGTIEVHLHIDGVGHYSRIIDTGRPNPGVQLVTYAGTTRLHFLVNAADLTSVSIVTANALSLGPHVVQVRKVGSAYTLFVDGSTWGTLDAYAIAVDAPCDQPLQIGSTNSDPFDRFKGTIDEVRIWKTARTDEQLAASRAEMTEHWVDFESFGTVLAHFDADEAVVARPGSVVIDSIPNGGSLGGTFNAAPDLHPLAVGVGSRKAAGFGFGRHVAAEHVPGWNVLHNPDGRCTVLVRWYYSGGDVALLETAANLISPGVLLFAQGGELRLYVASSTASAQLLSVAGVTFGWNTVVLVKDGANVSLAINGGAAVARLFTNTQAADSAGPTIGVRRSGALPFRGLMSDLVIYDDALDDGTIDTAVSWIESRADVAPDYSPLQEVADIAAWYRADQVALDVGVETLFDESGHNNHMTQAVDAAQPAPVADWRNGRPALRNAGGDFLRGAAFTQGSVAQPSTEYVVAVVTSQPSGVAHITGPADPAVGRSDVYIDGAGAIGLFAGAHLLHPAAGADLGSAFVARTVANGVSSSIRTAFDGGAESAVTGNAGTAVLMGKTWFSWGDIATGPQCDIAEHLIFAGIVGDDDRTQDPHDTVLSSKYTIEVA